MYDTTTTLLVIPKDCCPRCYLRRLKERQPSEIRLQVRFQEHLLIHYCPMSECGYEAKETSSTMRVSFIAAQRYEYLHPRRGTLRIGRKS